jgi:NADH-quinone oxidoreductase subunit M
MKGPLLSLITFLPLAGAALLAFVPRDRKKLLYAIALGLTVLVFGLSLVLYFEFDGTIAVPQFVEKANWIASGLEYHLGVDGLSLFLVLLTTLLVPLAILSSWSAVTKNIRGYLMALLILETGMVGVFLALNLFLFYVFWEAALIPMYFLIGLWGGVRRFYATFKFVLFTMFGSVLMLVALIVLYNVSYTQTGAPSLNLHDLVGLALTPRLQAWLFLALALAFAIKIPLFPLHTWLPDAHVEAPTAGSVLLAGVLLKMGIYGFLRFGLPLFPGAASRFLPWLSALAIIGILYGGLMALIQKDIKSLVAYSSVSHMGLIGLALFALNVEGVEGAVFQMVNHGLSTGMLFLVVGMLYERAHTRQIADFGGVSRPMPLFSAFFLIAALSSMGLPGLNGFIGEITCLFGIFAAHATFAVFAVFTVILSAAYLLWMFRRVMQGPVVSDRVRGLKDLTLREILTLVPVVILMLALGLVPSLVTKKADASVQAYIRQVQEKKRIVVLDLHPAADVAAPRIPPNPEVK